MVVPHYPIFQMTIHYCLIDEMVGNEGSKLKLTILTEIN